MARVITSLCMRDGSCALVCPVECIIPGNPVDKYPWYYIDADTCIDCGSCEAECPYSAIFPSDEVPAAYTSQKDVRLSMPSGTPGFDEAYSGKNHEGSPVSLKATRVLKAGESVDLTPAIQANTEFFQGGPGYNAK